MHSAKKRHDSDDEYWVHFKADLQEAINELEWATSGRLMGPLLKHKNKEHVHVTIELPTKSEMKLVEEHVPGAEMTLIVDYE